MKLIAAMSKPKSESAFFYSLVEAIIPVSVPIRIGTDPAPVVNQVARFCSGQLSALSMLPRFMFEVGMTWFRLSAWARHGRGFTRLPLPVRAAMVEDWAWGKWTLQRDWFRVLRSTALVAFFDLLDEKAAEAVAQEMGKENLP